ncbi:hypothetical protein [Planctomicrobium sp. SH527]|uniref:hypothetical protein n=1 Tax=Planctomicrobium sp. SH527 TaxID=3448123 RepID=UPI003F5B081E
MTNRLGPNRVQSSGQQTLRDFNVATRFEADSLRAAFDRIVGIMQLKQPITLEIEAPAEATAEGGALVSLDSTPVVRIPQASLTDPNRVLAIVSREIARAVLKSEQHLTGKEPDVEPLLDLMTVFLGFGVFNANAKLLGTPPRGVGLYTWMMNQTKNLNALQFGYAMALNCWLRQETPGNWQQELARDSRDAMTQGLKFLKKSDTTEIFEKRPTGRDLVPFWERRLRTGSDALALDSFWDMGAQQFELTPGLTEELVRALHHDDSSLSKGALDILAAHPTQAAAADQDVLECLKHRSVRARFAAMGVLEVLQRTPELQATIVDVLTKERDHQVRMRAIRLLYTNFDAIDADGILPILVEDLRRSLLNQNREEVLLIVRLIDSLTNGEAESILRSRFGHTEDDDWLGQTLSALEAIRTGTSTDGDESQLDDSGIGEEATNEPSS